MVRKTVDVHGAVLWFVLRTGTCLLDIAACKHALRRNASPESALTAPFLDERGRPVPPIPPFDFSYLLFGAGFPPFGPAGQQRDASAGQHGTPAYVAAIPPRSRVESKRMTRSERSVVRREVERLTADIAAGGGQAAHGRADADVTAVDRWLRRHKLVLGQLVALL